MQIKADKQPEYVYKPRNIKFEGSTTYKNEFQGKKNANSDLPVGVDSANNASGAYHSNKPKVPFSGTTSYQDTFVKPIMNQEKQP